MKENVDKLQILLKYILVNYEFTHKIDKKMFYQQIDKLFSK
ncbi:hypothetical protein ACJA23_00020 [Mycoplasma corogypsi]